MERLLVVVLLWEGRLWLLGELYPGRLLLEGDVVVGRVAVGRVVVGRVVVEVPVLGAL